MCFHKNSFIVLFSLIVFSVYSQPTIQSDSIEYRTRTDSLVAPPKNQLKTAGIILATNLGVWCYDRYIVGGSYARINLNTIRFNFKTGFVGDNDGFMTNLLSHPYHGAVYFNAARMNGLNYWESIPYVAGGSLMWEFFLENEPASINDFLTSTVGGMTLGEMSFRISDRIIDDRSIGFERFKREALITLLSPIRGLNRIISGEAWRHRKIRGNALPSTPVTFYSSIGTSILSDMTHKKENSSKMLGYDLGLVYGNPFDQENEKPFDYFTLRISGNIFSQQSEISRVNALGQLVTKDLYVRKHSPQVSIGIYQHLNYYVIDSDTKNIFLSPLKISEAASVGPGLLIKCNLTNTINLTGSTYLSAILLGGNQCDHYREGIRNYNMGSGFSSKLNFDLNYDNRARLSLNLENYQLYSWIGNLPFIEENSGTDSAGEIGNANLSVVTLTLNYKISPHFYLSAEGSYYYRKNHYKYFAEVNQSILGNKVSIGYIF
ncbi:MAG: DUF3943 domain-containing protein [Paludibacter sp.]|nr:DUF3943 domain-containing protein [Paludibacter sp.]